MNMNVSSGFGQKDWDYPLIAGRIAESTLAADDSVASSSSRGPCDTESRFYRESSETPPTTLDEIPSVLQEDIREAVKQAEQGRFQTALRKVDQIQDEEPRASGYHSLMPNLPYENEIGAHAALCKKVAQFQNPDQRIFLLEQLVKNLPPGGEMEALKSLQKLTEENVSNSYYQVRLIDQIQSEYQIQLKNIRHQAHTVAQLPYLPLRYVKKKHAELCREARDIGYGDARQLASLCDKIIGPLLLENKREEIQQSFTKRLSLDGSP